MSERIGGAYQRWLLKLPKRCPNCKKGGIKIVTLGGNTTAVCDRDCDKRTIGTAYHELRQSGASTLPGFGDDQVEVVPKRTRRQQLA